MQMLLTSQQGRVWRKSHWCWWVCRVSKVNFVFYAQKPFDHAVQTHLGIAKCTSSVLLVNAAPCSRGGKQSALTQRPKWSTLCIYFVYVICLCKRENVSPVTNVNTREGHPPNNEYVCSCKTLPAVQDAGRTIPLACPHPQEYLLEAIPIYLSICQHVVEKVDETASGLPFMWE